MRCRAESPLPEDEGVGVGVAIGVGAGVAVGLGRGVAVGEGAGVGVAVGAGVGVALGAGDGVGVGVGVGEAAGTTTERGMDVPLTISREGFAGGAPLKVNPTETDPPAGIDAFHEAGMI